MSRWAAASVIVSKIKERDDAKMADLNRRFNEVQDQLERGYRMIPERKGEKQEAPGVEAVRKQIADLERKMAVEDSIFTLEERIRRLNEPKKPAVKKEKKPLSTDLKSIEDAFRESLGTKVTLSGSSARGKITIEYYNREDLERVYERIYGKE